MTHPRRAARAPLKGAMPVGRETRTHGILALRRQAPELVRFNLNLNGSN
jgi:hypothetical protein